MPCKEQSLEIEFDFIDRVLSLRRSDGAQDRAGETVATFHAEVMARSARTST